jgi:hypothetical protein
MPDKTELDLKRTGAPSGGVSSSNKSVTPTEPTTPAVEPKVEPKEQTKPPESQSTGTKEPIVGYEENISQLFIVDGRISASFTNKENGNTARVVEKRTLQKTTFNVSLYDKDGREKQVYQETSYPDGKQAILFAKQLTGNLKPISERVSAVKGVSWETKNGDEFVIIGQEPGQPAGWLRVENRRKDGNGYGKLISIDNLDFFDGDGVIPGSVKIPKTSKPKSPVASTDAVTQPIYESSLPGDVSYSEFKKLYSQADLLSIMVGTKHIETNDGAPLTMSAKDALEEIDAELAIYEKIKGCIG